MFNQRILTWLSMKNDHAAISWQVGCEVPAFTTLLGAVDYLDDIALGVSYLVVLHARMSDGRILR